MILTDIFTENSVILSLQSTDKDEVFEEMTETVIAQNSDLKREEVLASLHEREAKMSTGIMHAIAVPHGYSEKEKKVTGVIGISKNGIDYESLDGAPVNVIFMIICNPMDSETHLKVLKELAVVLQNKNFISDILVLNNKKDVIQLIERYAKMSGL